MGDPLQNFKDSFANASNYEFVFLQTDPGFGEVYKPVNDSSPIPINNLKNRCIAKLKTKPTEDKKRIAQLEEENKELIICKHRDLANYIRQEFTKNTGLIFIRFLSINDESAVILAHPNRVIKLQTSSYENEVLQLLNGCPYIIHPMKWFEVNLYCYTSSMELPFFKWTADWFCKLYPFYIPDVMQQLFKGIAYCHDHSILHRDVKPSNILVSLEDGCVHAVLADFDMAILRRKKLIKGRCGTDGYMAPEVLSHSYNRKIDIWSAGVVFFELLTETQLYTVSSDDNGMLDFFQNWSIRKWKASFLSKFCLSPNECNLLKLLLRITSSKRPEAKLILQHKYFKQRKQ